MGRNSTCFAPGCTSGYRNHDSKGISLFKAPKNPSEREKWACIISRHDRVLQENDVLCENHFQPKDITRYVEINKVKIPYQRPRLKVGAVPRKLSK